MIIGIDPGVKGGAALLTDIGEVISVTAFEGMTESELKGLVAGWRELGCRYGSPLAIMEKVGFIKGDGGKGAFTFGKVYGLLRGLLLGNGFTIHDVYPMMWQARMGCLSDGNKNVTKNAAIKIFPLFHSGRKHGITHGIADAMLIAEYGRMAVIRRNV